MLKRPEAASIKEAGSFYLQVGYDEYYDIGQSAWSGDKYVPTERIVKKIDDSISFVNNSGSVIKKSVEVVKQEVQEEDLGDQLTNIVKYLHKIAEDDGFKVNKLWLPSLKKVMLLSDVLKKYPDELTSDEQVSIKAVVGEYDAPAEQKKGLLGFDLVNDGNILIYGTPGCEKENIISTIIYYLSSVMSQMILIFI